MAKQKPAQNNGAAVNPAVASAVANLEAARKQLKSAQDAFSAANDGYIETVESTKTPLELLDELEKIVPLNEAEFQVLQRYASLEMGARLDAIAELFGELRRAIERTTT